MTDSLAVIDSLRRVVAALHSPLAVAVRDTVLVQTPAAPLWPAALAALSALAGLGAAVAAFVLVGITGRYAEHTQRMVEEMQADRLRRVRPKLVPLFVHAGPPAGRGNIYVMNTGEGTALDIDVTLHLAPNGSRTRLISPMLRSGEKRMWNPTLDGSAGAEDHPFFPDSTLGRTHLHLVGRCRDVDGLWHDVDETTPLRDGWQVILDIEIPQP